MNRAAQALGRRAKGVPKKFSKEELAKRTERILTARKQSLEAKALGTLKKIAKALGVEVGDLV
jgi:DNA-binding Xre family transcriptional regulator